MARSRSGSRRSSAADVRSPWAGAAGLAAPALLASALLAPDPAAGERLAFVPEQGARLTLCYEEHIELEQRSQSFEVLVDGEEHDSQAPEIELSMVEDERVVFTDELLSVADGRVTRARRSFEELTGNSSQTVTDPEGEEHEIERASASALEGAAVAFAWDADEEEYAVAFDQGEEGDDELLAGLAFADDLTCFLPAGEVESGDTWDVDPAAYLTLTRPGGDVAIAPEDESEDGAEERRARRARFAENLAGTIEAEYRGRRATDDGERAVVHLALELESSAAVEREIDEGGAEGKRTETSAIALELGGELLWDPAARRAASIRLEGDVALTITDESEYTMQGSAISLKLVRELAGRLRVETTIE